MDDLIFSAKRSAWICIEANMGSGKTTLSEHISKHLASIQKDGRGYGFLLLEEKWQENPFFNEYYEAIGRFYKDLKQGANERKAPRLEPDPIFFHSQYWFLTKKGNQNSEIPSLLIRRNVLQDRSAHGDGIFAENLMDLGLFSWGNSQIYRDAYQGLIKYPLPDLLIYLQTSPEVCLERIVKRGRPQEKDIPPNYLASLHGRYESWWHTYSAANPSNALLINTDNLNLADSEADISSVLTKIRDRLEQKLN
jgi:deoxyguanosine kinase